MLKTGALIYSETLYTSQDFLNKLHPETINGSIFENSCTIHNEENITIRKLKDMLSKDVFMKILYCLLNGVKVSQIFFIF